MAYHQQERSSCQSHAARNGTQRQYNALTGLPLLDVEMGAAGPGSDAS
eukprot:CAMPEP_0202905478 /NCGR_PEP_ID=MMETSP1392-20130828/34441_1 /ASSEMBLY_ACC=CAM_ASM_000868 /TAXON_ID=225041 /ORGANISM="Chlamydomonas chlamydogama, Strain SAG 11-48b" /LENGTH=47 /DNA_ID= /DNA_START= /DNA_END= /DNA_ORIENTATION=